MHSRLAPTFPFDRLCREPRALPFSSSFVRSKLTGWMWPEGATSAFRIRQCTFRGDARLIRIDILALIFLHLFANKYQVTYATYYNILYIFFDKLFFKIPFIYVYLFTRLLMKQNIQLKNKSVTNIRNGKREKGGQPSECEGRSVVPYGNFRPRIEMLLR
jgi:hypothetical protein